MGNNQKTNYKTSLLVLRATKYSEADLIIQGLAPDGGKLSLLARGALRSKKRFGPGILEPTHHIEIEYSKTSSEEGRLGHLLEARLLNDFRGLRENLERLETAFVVIQAIARVGQEGDVHSQDLYSLAGHSLQSLAKTTDILLFKLHFGLRFLLQQGVLDHEPWMMIYLKTPMAEHQLLKATKIEKQHLLWLETVLPRYLAAP